MMGDTIILINAGVVFVLAGATMTFKPPQRINSFYGYRTSRSMRSQQAWELAQRLSARSMLKWGGIQLGMALLTGLCSSYLPTTPILSLLFILGAVATMIIQTERALKKTFD